MGLSWVSSSHEKNFSVEPGGKETRSGRRRPLKREEGGASEEDILRRERQWRGWGVFLCKLKTVVRRKSIREKTTLKGQINKGGSDGGKRSAIREHNLPYAGRTGARGVVRDPFFCSHNQLPSRVGNSGVHTGFRSPGFEEQRAKGAKRRADYFFTITHNKGKHEPTAKRASL